MGKHFWDDVKQVKTLAAVEAVPADVVEKARAYLRSHLSDESDRALITDMLGIGDGVEH